MARGRRPRTRLPKATWHSLSLKVQTAGVSAAVEVLVDGKPRIAWSGLVTELNDGPGNLTESDRIGLIAGGALTLRTARLRVTSGRGLLVVREAAKHGP